MKRLLTSLIVISLAITLYADDLSIFQKYAQEADTAYNHGDTDLCLTTYEEIISLFNSNRKKNIKNNDICTIVFSAYSSLATLDKRKSEKEICSLFANALSLIEDNPAWIVDFTNKNYIINCYVNLIGGYSKLGDVKAACDYNQRMISFAEKHYRYEIADVLLNACLMYSLMNMHEKSYPLYQRLYKMFDDLDRLQQYKVITELIVFESNNENYSELVSLALKHEKLIAKSKDDIKETLLCLIGLGFNHNANNIAKENEGNFSAVADNAFKIGCDWALRNYTLIYPMICIDYAYWLYGFDEYGYRALEQYKLYLNAVEYTDQEKIFDQSYRQVEDAENALISIMIKEIVESPTPTDIDSILLKYPKIISAINSSPSRYYENFRETVEFCKEICYGVK